MAPPAGESRDPSAFFERLLPNSMLSLSMALAILAQEGMEGWLLVYIPPERRSPCEVMTSTHGWNLSLDPGSFNPRNRKRTS